MLLKNGQSCVYVLHITLESSIERPIYSYITKNHSGNQPYNRLPARTIAPCWPMTVKADTAFLNMKTRDIESINGHGKWAELNLCHELQTLARTVPRNINEKLVLNSVIHACRSRAIATDYLLTETGEYLSEYVFLKINKSATWLVLNLLLCSLLTKPARGHIKSFLVNQRKQ